MILHSKDSRPGDRASPTGLLPSFVHCLKGETRFLTVLDSLYISNLLGSYLAPSEN